MSVLIKGMEMPKDGDWVNVNICSDGSVYFIKSASNGFVFYGVHKGEAIEIPPHGRLIDADALTKMCREMQSIEWNNKASPYSWAYAYESFEGDIDNAPTIIEAEGE